MPYETDEDAREKLRREDPSRWMQEETEREFLGLLKAGRELLVKLKSVVIEFRNELTRGR